MWSLKVYLGLLAVLTLSGLLLMLRYVPSTAPLPATELSAGMSVGYVLRGVHFWAAQFSVLAVLAYLVRTVFVKTNWPRTGGVTVLALLTGLLWFTGTLLPWDQLAFWMQRWGRGISAQNALWIVYWTHTLVLPLLMLAFLLIDVRRTRRASAGPASL